MAYIKLSRREVAKAVENDFIIRSIAEASTPHKRRVEALRLFTAFEDTPGYIPTGAHNPPMYHYIDGPYIDSPYSIEEHEMYIRDQLRIESRIMKKLEAVFGSTPSNRFSHLQKRFRANKATTYRLLEVPEMSRRDLLPHDLFPFAEHFNSSVHRLAKEGWSAEETNFGNITFFPYVIGKGGFGGVYTGIGGQKSYALKIFHQEAVISPKFREKRHGLRGDITRNLRTSRDLFAQEPFVPLRGVYSDRKNAPTQLFVLQDFFPGECLEAIIKREGTGLQDKNLLGKVIVTYAGMLNTLHNKGLVFVDNNLGAILIGEDDTRICDYDLVSSPASAPREVRKYQYASREQMLGEEITQKSDLEGLAVMVDAIHYGGPLVQGRKDHRAHMHQARENKRTYPADRAKTLPPNLREIVSSLMTYPRSDFANSLSANDFVEATKKDYGV